MVSARVGDENAAILDGRMVPSELTSMRVTTMLLKASDGFDV